MFLLKPKNKAGMSAHIFKRNIKPQQQFLSSNHGFSSQADPDTVKCLFNKLTTS